MRTPVRSANVLYLAAPLFAGYRAHDYWAYRAIADDYVSLEDGTGVVHIAPGFGEDDSEMPREAQLDALGELANVICGNVLPEIAGDRETFALTPPVLLTEVLGPPAAWAGTVGEVRVGLDDGRAEVRLYLEGEVPAEARAEAA